MYIISSIVKQNHISPAVGDICNYNRWTPFYLIKNKCKVTVENKMVLIISDQFIPLVIV